MALNEKPKGAYLGRLFFVDGTTGTPVELELAFDEGNFSGGPFTAEMMEIVKVKRRGIMAGAVLSESIEPSGSFDCILTDFSDATAGEAQAFALKQAPYSANKSTMGDGAKVPYTIDIRWEIEGTDAGDDHDMTLTLLDCRVSVSVQEGPYNKCTISWECLGGTEGDWALVAAA